MPTTLDWRTKNHPNRVRTVHRHVEWPVCIQCDFGAYRTREAVAKAIATTRHDWMLLDYAPRRRDTFDAGQHAGHDVVWLHGDLWLGSRLNPAMAAGLRTLEPKLLKPVKRFQGDRRPQNEEIRKQLMALGRQDLFVAENMPADPRSCLGGRTTSQREDGESKGTSLIQEPEMLWSHKVRHKPIHTHVTIGSGINVIGVLEEYGKTLLWRLQALNRSDTADESPHVTEQMGWIVFGFYMDLMKHLPEYEPIVTREIRCEDYHSLPEMIAQLPISDEVRHQLIGDVAVLQFQVQHRTALLPEIKTSTQLLEALQQLPYPRMARLKGKTPRNRLAMIVKRIAQELERVTIARVDWTPVMNALHFPHEK